MLKPVKNNGHTQNQESHGSGKKNLSRLFGFCCKMFQFKDEDNIKMYIVLTIMLLDHMCKLNLDHFFTEDKFYEEQPFNI